MPRISSLYKRPLCQTLSNALEMSRKVPLTSSGGLWLKFD